MILSCPVKKAILETANLSALTVLITAFLLTFDPYLLGCGFGLEILYLIWAHKSTRYQERLNARSGKPVVKVLDRVLLVVTVAGFVVIFFFGFGKHLLNHKLPYLTHAQGWEAGAIGWTTLFLFYYLAKFRASGKVDVHILAMLIIGISYVVLLGLACYTLYVGEPRLHVVCVMLIGGCFCLIDSLSMKHHEDDYERKLSRASLRWADIPMVASVFVLLVYLLIHRDAEAPEVFVSGVISCQLLISNAVFVVMEFGLLGPPQPTSETKPARLVVPEKPEGVETEHASGASGPKAA